MPGGYVPLSHHFSKHLSIVVRVGIPLRRGIGCKHPARPNTVTQRFCNFLNCFKCNLYINSENHPRTHFLDMYLRAWLLCLILNIKRETNLLPFVGIIQVLPSTRIMILFWEIDLYNVYIQTEMMLAPQLPKMLLKNPHF